MVASGLSPEHPFWSGETGVSRAGAAYSAVTDSSKSEIAKDRWERHARRPAGDALEKANEERIAERSAHPLIGLVRS